MSEEQGDEGNAASAGEPGPSVKGQCLNYSPKTVNYFGGNAMDLDYTIFLWTINDFLETVGIEGHTSPSFYGGPKSKHEWKLRIRPGMWCETLCYETDLELVKPYATHPQDEPIKVKYAVSVLDDSGCPIIPNELALQDVLVYNLSEAEVTHSQHLMTQDDFLALEELALPDGKLRVVCELWTQKTSESQLVNGDRNEAVVLEDLKRESVDQLSADLGKLLLNDPSMRQMADVRLRVSGTLIFAHKAILAARSPVFAAIFRQPAKGGKQRVIEVPDFEKDVIEGMLQFIYTGTCQLITSKPKELYHIAIRYELPSLQRNCEDMMIKTIRVENAADLLIFSHENNNPKIKAAAIEFINFNRVEVRETPVFKEMVKNEKFTQLFVELYFGLS